MIRGLFRNLYVSSQMARKDLYDLRAPYNDDRDKISGEGLIPEDPMDLFNEWFHVAMNCKDINEPNGVCLATSDISTGQPSCRMVLVKHYSSREGFKFFTNYESRKAVELLANPLCAMLFYWAPIHRQVRIEGIVHKLSELESMEYFNSRPLKSKISAVVSDQSREIESYSQLVERCHELEETAGNGVVKPPHWGGYSLVPRSYEFWEGDSNRLHHRVLYKLLQPYQSMKWSIVRLAP
jgi:pyridoxamine 5'-phosphate oxidase